METGPIIGDAFGQAMLDRLEHGAGAGTHVIERDDGFVEAMSPEIYFGDPAAWSPVEESGAELLAGRVLDLGAGAGRHSLALQERGVAVTALDRSPGCAEVCRRRGVATVVAGTLDAVAAGRFDGIAMFGNNLGILGGREHAGVLLQRMAEITRPGAVLVGSTIDPYQTAAPHHLGYHERNRSLGRMPGQIGLRIRYRELATAWSDWLLLSIDELRALVAETPWRLRDVIADEGPVYAAILRR